MPNYEQGTLGKIIIQDWDVIQTYPAEKYLYELTPQQAAALVAVCPDMKWRTRWQNPPSKDTRDAFVAEMMFNLMNPLTLDCDDVADCIETNPGVQIAINNVYNNNSVSTPMPGSVSGANLYDNSDGCVEDELWGAIDQLIESMNQNNIDAFEVVEVATNLAERASMLFAAIPIAETLPLDEAIDYIQGIWTDDLFEAYIANDTEAYRDALKCDLFCLALGNGCVLSINDVFQYFINRLSGDASDTFAELVAYLTTGTWVGTEINDMFYAGQIMFMKYGNKFFDVVGIRPFQMYLNIGKRSPSSAWMDICDDCPDEHCFIWDMTLGLQGWQIFSGFGEFIPGVGIGADGQTVIWLYREDFDGRKINSVRIHVTPTIAAVQVGSPYNTLSAFAASNDTPPDLIVDVSANGGFAAVDSLAVRGTIDGIQVVTGIIEAIEVCYTGAEIDFEE